MTLKETMDRCHEMWRRRWELEQKPSECYEVTLHCPWDRAGTAISIIALWADEVLDCKHAPPDHIVRFRCTFEALQSIGKALDSVPVKERTCRLTPAGRIGG